MANTRPDTQGMTVRCYAGSHTSCADAVLDEAGQAVACACPCHDPEPIAVEYDLDVHLWGQRYLLTRKDSEPGYLTIPVADAT